MRKNILIVALPHVGKSTLLQRVLQNVDDKFGFVTNEVLSDGSRVGFEIEASFCKEKFMLANVDFHTPHKVSRYGVNLQGFKIILKHIPEFPDSSLLYIDEIGEMQLMLSEYPKYVSRFLDSRNTFIATLSCVYKHEFIEKLKKRKDTIVVELTPENRDEQFLFVSHLLKKIEKARGYIANPDRFSFPDGTILLAAEHGERKLVFKEDKWRCDCDFHNKYNVCSHSIATEDIFS